MRFSLAVALPVPGCAPILGRVNIGGESAATTARRRVYTMTESLPRTPRHHGHRVSACSHLADRALDRTQSEASGAATSTSRAARRCQRCWVSTLAGHTKRLSTPAPRPAPGHRPQAPEPGFWSLPAQRLDLRGGPGRARDGRRAAPPWPGGRGPRTAWRHLEPLHLKLHGLLTVVPPARARHRHAGATASKSRTCW